MGYLRDDRELNVSRAEIDDNTRARSSPSATQRGLIVDDGDVV